MARQTRNRPSLRASSGTHQARIGANATGAGSGAVLLYVLRSFPDDRPWKQVLLYFAPAFSLAVRRGVLWAVAVLGEYVRRKWNDQQRLWDYEREKAQLDRDEKELRELSARPSLSVKSREEIAKTLTDIEARRLEAFRRMSLG